MSASFSSALGAALEAAGSQHYPQGALYVVATPIGNLADISLRALHLLALADRVACEDTRHTQALLRAYGIDKPAAQLLAVHQHNEAQAAHTVVELLHAGLRVAYVSDAGTPGISDPGARLVAQVRAQGLARAVGAVVAGVSALAAPVLDHRGEIVLALTAIGPSAALDTGWQSPMAQLLRNAGIEASARLGWRANLPPASDPKA